MKVIASIAIGIIIGIIGTYQYLQNQISDTSQSVANIEQLINRTIAKENVAKTRNNVFLLGGLLETFQSKVENNEGAEKMLLYVAEVLQAEFKNVEILKEKHDFTESDLQKFDELQKNNEAVLNWYR